MISELIKRYLNLEKSRKLPYEKIENSLNISFSSEFKRINNLARFDYLDVLEWYNSDQTDDYSMIGESLFLRKEFNLPNNIVAIANQGESMLFMKCFGDHEEIYWIDNIDIERFCNGKPLASEYRHFPTFEDFFKFLLDEEEAARAEE